MRRSSISILIAAAVALVGPPAVAASNSYFFRAKPTAVSAPEQIVFGASSGLNPGDLATSSVQRAANYGGRSLSVQGSAGASYQVCAAPDCSDQGSNWRTSVTSSIPNDFFLRARVTVGAFGTETRAVLSLDGAEAIFSASPRSKDVDPDVLTAFGAVGAAAASTEVLSETKRLTGHDGISVSVSGASASFRICATTCSGSSGWTTVATEAPPNSYVQLRTVASSVGDGDASATLMYGGRTASWSVKTAPALSTGAYTCATILADGTSPGAFSNGVYSFDYIRVRGRLSDPAVLVFDDYSDGASQLKCSSTASRLTITMDDLYQPLRFIHGSMGSCPRSIIGCGTMISAPKNETATVNRICQELGYNSGSMSGFGQNSFSQARWTGAAWTMVSDVGGNDDAKILSCDR